MLEFIREFYDFIRSRKRYWLLPIFISLALLGGLIIFAESSVLGPLIYPLF